MIGSSPAASQNQIHLLPFTLILGSGFSYPIVPVTSEIVRQDLPWWKWCQHRTDPPTRDDYRNRNEAPFVAEAKEQAKIFWQKVLKDQQDTMLMPGHTAKAFTLGSDGLPTTETIGEAYRYVLGCTLGLHNPAEVRSYFGDMVCRIGNRLNPAHFFLASITAECKGLFGTAFTTNFDPLLQRSLQLFNVPYFVSDRPETLQSPDDDHVQNELHLIHAHGSVYRYILASTPDEIEEFARKNHQLLAAYFQRHTVLIVGFSGWDDAITRALKTIDRFPNSLYWCDRGTDPETSGLTADAKAILAKPGAFYVPIKNADTLLAQMHQHLLGYTLPQLFRDPIAVARKQFDFCDLKGVKLPRNPTPSASTTDTSSSIGAASTAGTMEELDLGEAVEDVKSELRHAEAIINGEASEIVNALATGVRRRFKIATDIYFGLQPVNALPDLNFVVDNSHVLTSAERALALFRRGYVYGDRNLPGDVDLAIADYTAALAMPDVSAEQRSTALVNRGFTYGQRNLPGDIDLAIADYTAVPAMPDVSAEQRSTALVNRGVAYGQRKQLGDVDLEIADYTAVLAMPDVSAAQRSKALLNRGITYGERNLPGDTDLAIADYTAALAMPDVPIERRSKALVNRGFTYGQRKQLGDVDLEVADYTAVLAMPDAPIEQRSKALVNRGITYGQRDLPGDTDLAIADYTAMLTMPDFPIEQRMKVQAQLDMLTVKNEETKKNQSEK